MSANIHCWKASLNLDPNDFDAYSAFVETEGEPPSQAVHDLVADLVAAYPYRSEEPTYRNPWAVEPLQADAHGDFIDLPIIFEQYDEIAPSIVTIANRRGFNSYDPQTGVISRACINSTSRYHELVHQL